MAKSKKQNRPCGVTLRRNWKALFLKHLADCGNVRLAADAAGVSRTVAYDHRESDKGFAADWARAMDDAADALEAEARRRAVEGLVQKKFTKDGSPVVDPETGKQYFERAYSDTLLVFLLKGARPEKFRDTHHHHHDGNLGIIRTPAEGEAEADQILDRLREQLGIDAGAASAG
jgi:hypothetical protein